MCSKKSVNQTFTMFERMQI